MLIGSIVLLAIVFLSIAFFVGIYNGLVSARRDVDNSLSQIDVQLRRRYDLIPNLVETAKESMKFEQETLQKVIEARNSALGARSVGEKAAADAQVSSALNGFFALSEAYPELKSNQNLMQLQDELKDTEDKIAYSRQGYNDSVTRLNTMTDQFPSGFVAGMAGVKARELYVVEETAAREPVRVKF